MTGPVNWVANLRSSGELSPFWGAEGFLGKRMNLERYLFRCCMLVCRDSMDLFRLLGSTEIPTVRATLNSSKLKPWLARTLSWYLTMGHPDGSECRAWGDVVCFGLLDLVSVDLLCWLVKPCGYTSLPVLVEV